MGFQYNNRVVHVIGETAEVGKFILICFRRLLKIYVYIQFIKLNTMKFWILACLDKYPRKLSSSCKRKHSCGKLSKAKKCSKTLQSALSNSCKKRIARNELKKRVSSYCAKSCRICRSKEKSKKLATNIIITLNFVNWLFIFHHIIFLLSFFSWKSEVGKEKDTKIYLNGVISWNGHWDGLKIQWYYFQFGT